MGAVFNNMSLPLLELIYSIFTPKLGSDFIITDFTSTEKRYAENFDSSLTFTIKICDEKKNISHSSTKIFNSIKKYLLPLAVAWRAGD